LRTISDAALTLSFALGPVPFATRIRLRLLIGPATAAERHADNPARGGHVRWVRVRCIFSRGGKRRGPVTPQSKQLVVIPAEWRRHLVTTAAGAGPSTRALAPRASHARAEPRPEVIAGFAASPRSAGSRLDNLRVPQSLSASALLRPPCGARRFGPERGLVPPPSASLLRARTILPSAHLGPRVPAAPRTAVIAALAVVRSRLWDVGGARLAGVRFGEVGNGGRKGRPREDGRPLQAEPSAPENKKTTRPAGARPCRAVSSPASKPGGREVRFRPGASNTTSASGFGASNPGQAARKKATGRPPRE